MYEWESRIVAREDLHQVRNTVAVTVLVRDGIESFGNRGFLASLAQLATNVLEPGAEGVVRLAGLGVAGPAGLVGEVAGAAVVEPGGQGGAEQLGERLLVGGPGLGRGGG